ncbi:MAG TPA: glycosyltransferase family 1 protein [Devosiaceae bacterium]|nr:glycosyltransferase family 1 protein [Devosiaceae bacterium]
MREGSIISTPPGTPIASPSEAKNLLNRFQAPLSRRWRQLAWLAREEGMAGVSSRLRLKLADAIRPSQRRWAVRPEDVLAADLDAPFVPLIPKCEAGKPILVNWVMTGPGPGSGGHTTMFRVLRHLEANGFRNRVYLYHPSLTDPDYYVSVIRNYYGFGGPVARLDGAMDDAHAVIATSWPSAYPVFNARSSGKRFYFVQDLEPDFYPVGAERILAENTYRMGLHAITAGRWLAERLTKDYSMAADHFDFGCDTQRYRNRGEARTGIVYYARPSTPRRGFEIGLLALQILKARRPDIEIHLYGERVGRLPFKATDHGTVTPDRLNGIYNRCFAGLSLSFTNVSLVPLEMLATGCIPVVNEAHHNRLVLDSPHVRYAAPTPHALARALEEIVSAADFGALSSAAAQSQAASSWDNAGETVADVIRRTIGKAGAPIMAT